MKILCLFLCLHSTLIYSQEDADSNHPCNKIISKLSNESRVNIVFSRNLDDIERIRAFWNDDAFSDPRNFNSEKYRFIIRVDSPASYNYYNRMRNFKDFILSYESSISMASSSTINENYNGSFFNAGWAFILSVPEENIIASLPKDSGWLGSARKYGTYTSQEDMIGRTLKHGLHTPDQLMKESILLQNESLKSQGRSPIKEREYNEVFIKGQTIIEDRQINTKITGIVIFKDRSKGFMSADKPFLHELGQELDIPVFEMSDAPL